MPLTAKDVMQSQVVSVSPEDPLSSAQRLFFEEEIHGAPVVDDEGRVVGMLSTIDLLRAAAEEHDTEMPAPDMADLEFSLPQWGNPDAYAERVGATTVADAMTESVVSVAPDATIPEIAGTLRRNRIHRVLVVNKGFLEGVISTFDLVGLLEKEG